MARTGIDRYIYNSPEELKEEFGGVWFLVIETYTWVWNIEEHYCVQYLMDSRRFITISPDQEPQLQFAVSYKAVKKFIRIHHELRAFK